MADKETKTEESKQDVWLSKLISLLFWIFFIAAIAYIVFTIIVPRPSEWEAVTKQIGGFPENFTLKYFGEAIIRHLAFWSNYLSIPFLINTINFTFLTIFIRHIEKNYKNLDYCNGKIRLSVYVEWAMVALISGILYFSALVTSSDFLDTISRVTAIVVFALILYFVLFKFRNDLKEKEDKEEDAFKKAKLNEKSVLS